MQYQQCTTFQFGCHIDNVFTAAERFFTWAWSGVIESFASMLSLIPVPSFIENASLSIPSTMVWFTDALEVPFGLSVVVAAYTTRFLIRRLPVIG